MMTLTVPMIPPSPNLLKRKYRHPMAYKRLREYWEGHLFASPSATQRTQLKRQAKQAGVLWVQMAVYHSRLYDEDNLQGSYKVVLDALVRIGFLAGDSPDRLRLEPAVQIKSSRKDAHTLVKIGVVD